jgi:uncharacterized protein YqjF (DUF2071 family)
MSHDFDYTILNETAHRPWPLLESPWVMRQTWNDLLFAHWPVDVLHLRHLVPSTLELDLFEGQAWVAVVPFHMTNVAPRGVPALPWISAFPELNVRTYVRRNGRAGVYFFSLDATNPVAVGVARTFVHLPYFKASMAVECSGDWVTYRSSRSSAVAEFAGRYRAIAPAARPVDGTLEHYLTERYCLFTTDTSGRPLSLDIHHPPWPLQPAEAEIERNTVAQAAGIMLPATPPLLHFSKRQDMVGWMLKQA